MSKKLNEINPVLSEDQLDVAYRSGMQRYYNDMKRGTMQTRESVANALETRINGATLLRNTGKSLHVPSLDEDEKGNLRWGTEPATKDMFARSQKQPQAGITASRYDEASRKLGIDLSENYENPARGQDFEK